MQRFAKEGDNKRIDIGDGDWIEIPSIVSYGLMTKIGEFKGSDIERTGFMILSLVKAWSFKDGDMEVPITMDWINRLDIKTIQSISAPLAQALGVEKKISMG